MPERLNGSDSKSDIPFNKVSGVQIPLPPPIIKSSPLVKTSGSAQPLLRYERKWLNGLVSPAHVNKLTERIRSIALAIRAEKALYLNSTEGSNPSASAIELSSMNQKKKG